MKPGDASVRPEPDERVVRFSPKSRSRWLGAPAERAEQEAILAVPAQRVVSLVPSLTEAVFRLGAGSRLIARTEFCVRPEGQVEGVEAVGGTKNPDVQRIRELRPDVILSAKEENTRRRIEALARDFPVWLTDAQSPDDVPFLWRELGAILGLAGAGEERACAVERELELCRRSAAASDESGPRFLYYIWKSPTMVAGHGTYISNLLESVGFRNALPPGLVRFPKLTPRVIAEASPDVHFFSTEPHAFKLPRDLDLIGDPRAFRLEGEGWVSSAGARARLVDAQPLSWYPSLTLGGLGYASSLLADVRPRIFPRLETRL